MTNPSKLQSGAIEQYKKISKSFIHTEVDKKEGGYVLTNKDIDKKVIKFLTNQIQKAYEAGYVSGIKDEKILGNKTFELSNQVNKECDHSGGWVIDKNGISHCGNCDYSQKHY